VRNFRWYRENIDSIAIALIAALAIRHFTLEAFKIPTKSMEPTLMGNQPLYAGGRSAPGRFLGWLHWLFTGSGDRILVGKPLLRLRGPDRWSVIVFVYPWPFPHCPHCRSGRNQESVWTSDRICPNPICLKRTETVPVYRHFIKRLVGLPGETLLIRDGDVHINGSVAAKPLRIQKGLWQRVADRELLLMEGLAAQTGMPWEIRSTRTDYARARRRLGRLSADEQTALLDAMHRGHVEVRSARAGGGGARLKAVWREAGGAWEMTGGALTGRAEAGGKAFVRYAREIRDTYADDDGGGQKSGSNVVGDIRLRFRAVVGEGGGDLLAVIERNDERIEMRFGAGPDGCAVWRSGAPLASAKAAALTPGREHAVDVWLWDGRGRLLLDGEEIAAFALPGATLPRERTVHSGVRLGVAGGTATFRDVRIERDIHYTTDYIARISTNRQGVDKPLAIPEDSYFVLGDNSPSSKDGRMWDDPPFVPARNISGKAILKFFPPGRIGFIR
jgi:signal peptidase I